MLRTTVIIPTYNRAHLLKESLDSILNQTRQPDEIIVVNDGSTDGTADLLSSYGSRIELISKRNGGKPSAINLAIPRATGDLIWIFDDDDIAFADALESHLEVHEKYPEIGFSYSSFVWMLPKDTGWEAVWPEQFIPEMQPNEIHYWLLEGCLINQQGMLLKKRCFADIGLYREDMQRAEDYEFFLRLTRRFEGRRKPGPSYYFRQHEGPRGAKAIAHDPSERPKHFFIYEQMLWRENLAQYPLVEYLPHALRADPLLPPARREALLRRAMVAARNGHPDYVMRDLGEVAALTHSAPLNKRETRSCEIAFARPEADLFAAKHPTMEQLATLLSTPAMRQIALAFAAGIARARQNLLDEGRADDVAVLQQLSRRFTGTLGAIKLLGYKLHKRLRATGVL